MHENVFLRRGRKLISLAGSILLCVSMICLVSNIVVNPTAVKAAKATRGSKVKLVKTAYIYNKNDHKMLKKPLKKGKTYVIKGTKYIQGKKYYVLSEKRYVKADKDELAEPEIVYYDSKAMVSVVFSYTFRIILVGLILIIIPTLIPKLIIWFFT